MFDTYLNFNFKFIAYAIGYIYLAVPYVLSFVFPPLKRVLLEFLENGSNRSNFIISIISGSLIFYLSWFKYDDMSFKLDSHIKIVLLYLGYVGFGFFGLFLLADHRLAAPTKQIK